MPNSTTTKRPQSMTQRIGELERELNVSQSNVPSNPSLRRERLEYLENKLATRDDRPSDAEILAGLDTGADFYHSAAGC